MRLISVHLANFRSHRDTRVQFGDDVLAISGANGSGKSSIFEGAFWAMFGVCRTRTQDELIRAGEREASVHVVFQVGELAYEVNRAYRTQGKSGTTRLVFSDPIHGDLTKPTVKETEAAIIEVVGPYHVLAATAYVGQGDGDRFLRARPAERRDIFGASLAVDPRWGAWQVAATVEGKRLDETIRTKQGQLESAEYESQPLAELTAQHVKGEGETAGLTATVTAAEGGYDRRRSLYERGAAIRQANAALETRRSEMRWQLGNVQPKMRELRKTLDHYESLIQNAVAIEGAAEVARTANAAYDQALIAHDDSMAQFRKAATKWREDRQVHVGAIELSKKNVALRADLEAQLTLAEGSLAEAKAQPADRCVTCKQPLLTGEAAGHVAEHLQYLDNRLTELKSKLAAIPITTEEIIASLMLALEGHDKQEPEPPARPPQPAMADYTRAISRLTMLEGARKTIDADRKAMAELEAQLVELPGRIASVESQMQPEAAMTEGEVQEARSRLVAARSALQSHVKAQAGLAARVEAAQGQKAKAAALRTELVDLRARHDVYTLIADACGPRGVRQLIADQALAQVQDEANRRLQVLQPGYGVYFSTLTESGRESLDVGISTPEGLRSFESLSGGEGTRVAIAVRLAMSVVASNMHGLAALPAFWMDEAFGSQDAAGKDAFVECIADMAQTVGQVVVVSHDAEFQERFDNKIVLAKVDGETKVTT